MKRYIENESGQAMTEYVLILAAIALVVIMVVGKLGTTVLGLYDNILDEVVNA